MEVQMNHRSKILTSLIAALLTAASLNTAWATETSAQTAPKVAVSTAKSSSAKANAAMELAKRNNALVKEAVTANDEILQTISYLEKGKKDKAYKTLADAAGKLDVVLARDPHLKFAPIDVRSKTMEIVMKPDEIKDAVKDARVALDDGHIQKARSILDPLTSEIRFSTDYLPMETYPAAIKIAVTKIQKGDLKGAEHDLYDVLSTIVTSDEVIPIPPIVAQADIHEAEQLINKDKVKNKDQAVALLQKADQQLEVSKLLGYGEYKDVKKEIGSVESRIKSNSPGTNLFGKLKQLLGEIRSKV
jgi:hypothetical protein